MPPKSTSIMVLLSRFPYPLEKGDKLRAYQHITMLARSGYNVHLVALTDVPVTEEHKEVLRPFCTTITVFQLSVMQRIGNIITGLFRGLPLQVAYFTSAALIQRMQSLAQTLRPSMAYVQLIRMAEYGRGLSDTLPVVFDYQDAFSRGLALRAEQSVWPMSLLFHIEQTRVRTYEERVRRWFKSYMVIAEQDKVALGSAGADVTIVPNAVAIEQQETVTVEKDVDVLFVGNMQYAPNVDAVQFLVQSIMPRVWKKLPNVQVCIAGATPSAQVRALAGPRVTVTGWVDDVRSVYRRAQLFVAPMRIGSGLQNKLLEAMAMSVPCITTTISAEPLGKTDASPCRVANDAATFADAIVELLTNNDARRALGYYGQKHVEQMFGAEKVSAQLESAVTRALL